MNDLANGWYWTRDMNGNLMIAQVYTLEHGEKRIVFTHKDTSWRSDLNLFNFLNTVYPKLFPVSQPPGDF